jgi:hypothetical protein
VDLLSALGYGLSGRHWGKSTSFIADHQTGLIPAYLERLYRGYSALRELEQFHDSQHGLSGSSPATRWRGRALIGRNSLLWSVRVFRYVELHENRRGLRRCRDHGERTYAREIRERAELVTDWKACFGIVPNLD